MSDRLPERIVRDLGRKASADASAATERVLALADHPADLLNIATYPTAAALGMVAAFVERAFEVRGTPEELADAVWALFRPITVAGIQAARQSRQQERGAE